MSVTTRRFSCTPEQVFEALADPWLFPAWVVGVCRVRAADSTYPKQGSELHDSVGVWPFVLAETTRVEAWDPPRRLVLTAKAWPIGSERVTIEVQPRGSGCVVRMEEYATDGIAARVPGLIADVLLHFHNTETLRRLEWVAKGMAASRP